MEGEYIPSKRKNKKGLGDITYSLILHNMYTKIMEVDL
jgi:hypothetical protein